jgi:hypothetical protein
MTGNDLLNKGQAFFTYAGVAITPIRAEAVVRSVRPKCNQGMELKGRNLLGTVHGRRAITNLLDQVREDAHLVVHHKQYALACKFFEYIFEPVLANRSRLFYEADFHRFISNLLFIWSLTRQESAEQLLADFAGYMRSLNPGLVPSFFDGRSTIVRAGAETDPLNAIGTFCVIHRQKIAQEVKDLRDTNAGKWVLDLTSSSLFSILSYWGERYEQLDVFCDDSKPLRGNDLFPTMVNRTDCVYQTLRDRRRRLTFNLARSTQLVRSKDHFGIQVADVLASTLRHALEHRDETDSQEWLNILSDSISSESVFPAPDVIDLDTPEAMVNAFLLQELVDRSVRGRDLFDGLPELMAAVRTNLPNFKRLKNS